MNDSEARQAQLAQYIRNALHVEKGGADVGRLRRGDIGYLLCALVDAFTEVERQARCFGTDVEIHHAEIHMIMAIHEKEGIHVGGLAEKLGITKGSVSELLRKLERKGLVRKDVDPAKRSRVNVFLTEKGRTAHEQHVAYHERLNALLDGVLRRHPPEQRGLLALFLDEIRAELAA